MDPCPLCGCVLPSLRHYVELVVCSVLTTYTAPRSALELCVYAVMCSRDLLRDATAHGYSDTCSSVLCTLLA